MAASRTRHGRLTTTKTHRGAAGQVRAEQILTCKNRGGTAQSGAFRAFEGVPFWPLLRPWSRVRPAARVVPLSAGPNLSRSRLSGVPLRWSHACLLQPLTTVHDPKPDHVKVVDRSMPAFAKHSWRLRPSFGPVNDHFSVKLLFLTQLPGTPGRTPVRSMPWIDREALPIIDWGTSYLPSPLLFSTGQRRPPSNESSVPPAQVDPVIPLRSAPAYGLHAGVQVQDQVRYFLDLADDRTVGAEPAHHLVDTQVAAVADGPQARFPMIATSDPSIGTRCGPARPLSGDRLP